MWQVQNQTLHKESLKEEIQHLQQQQEEAQAQSLAPSPAAPLHRLDEMQAYESENSLSQQVCPQSLDIQAIRGLGI